MTGRHAASPRSGSGGDGVEAGTSSRPTVAPSEDTQRGFPPDFTWGAATSAYQIEGAPREDGKGESIWDRFVRVPGVIAGGANGDVACDHYHRWRDDVALMAEIGLRAYRFSAAWTRILPDGRGPVNEPGLAFYDRLVDELLRVGVEPWVTLYHWDLPQALEDRGGWPARDTADRFAEYADVMARRLGDRVVSWITINEPWEIGIKGYHRGVHAPGRRDLGAALAAIHTVLRAHGAAIRVIQAHVPRARCGIALSPSACYPATEADQAAAARLDGHFNRWFLDPLFGRGYPDDMVELYGAAAPRVEPGDLATIAQPLGFLGINYYYSKWVADDPASLPLRAREMDPPADVGLTATGDSVDPDGLFDTLTRLHTLYAPVSIVITESGAVYEDRPTPTGGIDDHDRAAYHARYLEAVHRARAAGAPVDGYFAWSLMDNFEWQQGFGPRFGLVRVDYATQRRTLKESARWYARVIAEGRL